ncbi:hypothetical protein BDZ88DRAFT_455090 [Geranomyces variabilis]|nr:hypothetical protein BDZ88DRAFT_455090 [Geranomyces variabilis]KAJ3133990.1 hypothetical protein HDU90_005338 [Geranomyces variabilis]
MPESQELHELRDGVAAEMATDTSDPNLNIHSSAPETFTVEPYDAPPASIRNFYIIAGGYVVYTLTDAALRMIVLFGLYQRHYQPLEIALMFTSYEALGVVTNLFGGIMGSRWGLQSCILAGLLLQLVGICLLFGLLRSESWSKGTVIGYVIFAQSFAGVAKDLVELAGKSVTKLVAKEDDGLNSPLFQLVAWLTGAKNSVKGLGFFELSSATQGRFLWGEVARYLCRHQIYLLDHFR